MTDSVKRSELYYSSARAIWLNLEKRFSVTNGSIKYKLSKEAFEVKQNGNTIDDYYTRMTVIWEELENLNTLPAVTTIAPDVTALLQALERQKEDQRLFQFLNGLDDDYSSERSQLLLQTPLPCATLQQEEAQRDVLNSSKVNVEGAAMKTSRGGRFKGESSNTGSKGNQDTGCKVCGRKNHAAEKCWEVIGYPMGHPLAKGNTKGSKREATPSQKWNKGKSGGYKMAANVRAQGEKGGFSGTLTPQQVEQLLKLLPNSNKPESDPDEEVETAFAGLTFKDA